MSDFRGFSEIEINGGDNSKNSDKQVPTNQSKKAFKKSPKKLAATTLPTLEEVPPEALLCSPPKKPAAKTQPKTDEVLSEAILSSPTVSSTTKELVNLNESQDPDILDGISEENGNLSKIEALELRQKQMEGDNKRKRQLLLQEIADRRQRTAEEAQKLAHVQTELQKIDLLVATDVKILRQTIEVASVEYMQAKKRYHHAEKEFVESKLNLHIKQERKELLTEHLMTIIQESEDRKSKKLAELMNRLQIEDKDCDT